MPQAPDWSIAFPLEPLTEHLAVPPDRFGLLTGATFGWFFVRPTPLHVPEDALALHLFLEHPQSPIDVVIAHEDLHVRDASLKDCLPPLRQQKTRSRRIRL